MHVDQQTCVARSLLSSSSAAPSFVHKGVFEANTWTRPRIDSRVIHSGRDATFVSTKPTCNSVGDGSTCSGSSTSGFPARLSHLSVRISKTAAGSHSMLLNCRLTPTGSMRNSTSGTEVRLFLISSRFKPRGQISCKSDGSLSSVTLAATNMPSVGGKSRATRPGGRLLDE